MYIAIGTPGKLLLHLLTVFSAGDVSATDLEKAVLKQYDNAVTPPAASGGPAALVRDGRRQDGVGGGYPRQLSSLC